MPVARRSSHRLHLAVSGALVIVAVVCLGVAEIVLDRRNTIEAAYQRLENLARIADEHISGRLVAVDLMLQDIGREYRAIEKREDVVALRAFMKARSAALDGVRSISITDAEGMIVESTIPSVVGFDGKERPYFTSARAATDRDRMFLNGPILATTGVVVIFSSRAQPAAAGEWHGVTIATLLPEMFVGVMESVRPEDGFGALVGLDGTIMARAGIPVDEKKGSTKASPFEAHSAKEREVGRRSVVVTTGDREMLTVHRTTRFSELGISIGRSQYDVLAPWRLKSSIIGGSILLLSLLGLVVLRMFARHEGEITAQRNFARMVVETANLLVVGTSAYGTIRLFNAAAEATSGYDRDALAGRPWLDILKSDDGLDDIRDGFRQGAPGSGEFLATLRTRDGGERIVEWRTNVVAGNPEIACMAFGLDITERLRAEQRLEANQRFLQTITDALPGMVGYWDADMRCRFANKAYLEWFGRRPEEILGRTMLDLMGENLFVRNEPHIRGALRGETQMFERTLTKADGSTGHTWAHYIPDIGADGVVLGFFVLVNDVTPLKKTEIRLREVSERLAVATRAGGIGIWSWDLETRGLEWDDRMYEMYQLDPTPPGPNYDTWRRALHPEDRDRIEAELTRAVSGPGAFDTEFRIVTPDGGIRHIKAAAMVDHDKDARPTRMVGVNWDVTVSREGEVALKAAQDRAERASRAKSEFLANMSHEIRTPMNAILGLAHLLERTDLSQDQRAMAGKIGMAGRSLLSIINDILDFSRVEAGRLELDETEFRLSDILDALSTIMSIDASTKDLELLIRTPPDLPTALIGDPLRLQQVLINLISNAIKFTERGEVSLGIERTADGEDGRVELRFAVEDTGIGIPTDVIPKLFDAFSQADGSTTRRFGGSGLGLAISKRLVELMGGRIGVESRPGLGSTFWFTVPLRSATTSHERRHAEEQHPLALLIADDHDVVRQSLAGFASTLGWTAVTTASGEDALEQARRQLQRHTPFDVVVLDWKMPGMDGLDVSRTIRDTQGLDHLPIVIMMTAYSREDLLRAPGAESVDAILIKPVTASSLFNAVTEARTRRNGSDAVIAGITVVDDERRLTGVRLLLVEDNAINQEIAMRVLEKEGAIVTVAGDGRRAVEAVTGSPGAFDAVLMDIQMPVMDGYRASALIRSDPRLRRLPIIALTAGALESEREEAYRSGMNDFIAKPFDVDRMIQCIRRHVSVPGSGGPLPVRVSEKVLDVAVPGIDMRQAALRLGGDNGLFASLLRQVRSDFADTVTHVRDHLAAHEIDAATRLLHTLRGASGNVAASDVAALAGAAEAAIRDAETTEAIEKSLNRLEDALAALMGSIAASGVLDAQQIAPSAANPTAIDGERIDALLAALNTRGMVAFELFRTLRPDLSSRIDDPTLAGIAEDIDGLRFSSAAEKLTTALRRS